MTFHSILFEKPEENIQAEAPAFFVDLNLDQVVETITVGKREYDLKPFFYTPLHEVDAVHYRQEVFRDLENPKLYDCLQTFAQRMRAMREHLVQADKLHYPLQKERFFIDAVRMYGDAVRGLAQDLQQCELHSRGMLAFSAYIAEYVQSDHFVSLMTEADQILADLSSIQYSIVSKGNTVRVRPYESEIDYSADVEETFAKFKQGAPKDYRVKITDYIDMNHIEAQILDLVAKLYPDVFGRLDAYCTKNANYLDEVIGRFDREIQFYLSYLDYTIRFRHAGLVFCYPRISNPSKEVYDYEGFDVALARKLLDAKSSVVCNDFYLKRQERILVVSGPNQGGKTTFARAFGQLHYLAALGCPVAGREARLFLFDRLFTHFEKEEDIQNLRGKLEDDLVRIHSILDQATPNSLIIMNEILTSTTVQDALFLGERIMERIIDLDVLCVFVTFLDELASMSEKTVSMVSTVVPENPALRTFKIVRRPADGLAYALAIADKYHLTYAVLKERLQS